MKKIKKKILIYIGRVYRFYLAHTWFRILVWFFPLNSTFNELNGKHYLKFAIKMFLILMYRSHFVFPMRKRKVVNTVIGPPGSGKTSLAAFWALKAKYRCSEKVYANADIIGTYEFDWERDYGTYLQEDCTIILDESGLDLDNRQFAMNFADVYDKKTGELLHNGRQKLLTLKYHRHLGQDLVILSQWTDQDVKIRNLSQNFFVCKKTGFPWLLCVKLYDTDIDVDPMSGDFRFVRKKKHTYFIFSPVIWFDFSTTNVPFEQPTKEWKIVE